LPKPDEAVDWRVPPHNIDAEQCALSSMMIDREYAGVGVELLRDRDFYRPSHAAIFRAICTVYEAGQPIDSYLVKDELERMGVLNEVGGMAYLMAITSQVPSASRIKHYAAAVIDRAAKRRLLALGQQIVALAYDDSLDATAAQAAAMQAMLAASDSRSDPGFVSARDVAQDVYEAMAEAQAHGLSVVGLRTGIPGLDRMTCGLPVGLTLIAARPSQGKTSLLLQICTKNPGPFGFFSLETTARALARRLITAGTRIETVKLRTGRLSDDEFAAVLRAVNDIYRLDLYIHDRPIDAGRLAAMARRAVLQYGLKAVLVDYVQLVRPKGGGSRGENREQQVASVTRALKELAQDLQIPIIAAAQLSRLTEKREGKLPELQDLRESGELEAAADLAILIHNQKPAEADQGLPRPCVLYVAKQKDGPTGPIHVQWCGSELRFYEESDREEASEEPYWTA